jgi:hypothetical protein
MARWRVPSNAIFRAASSRGVPRLEYAPQHEWDPQRISAVAGMVSNVNQAATNVMGIRPLDALTAGISSLAADPEKKGSGVQTGADIMRRAALARAKRDRAAADLKKMRQGAPKPAPAPAPAPGAAPGSLIDPTRTAPAPPTGIQDLSKMSFNSARRYARSTLGHEKFKWRGGIYSTVGYEPRAKPRPQRHKGPSGIETDTDWQRALEAARKRRGAPPAPAPSPADPTTLYPRTGPEAAVGDFSALQRLPKGTPAPEGLTQIGQLEALEILINAPNIAEVVGGPAEGRRGSLVDIVKILSDPSHPSYEEVANKVRLVSGPGKQYGSGQRVIDMLRPPTPAPTPTPTPAPPVIGDPDVGGARERERKRIDAILAGRPAPETPEARGARITTLGEMLSAGRIIAPSELPTNLQDLRALSQIVTDRDALVRIMRQARTSARPTRFSDLFTDDHERRAADQILSAFKAGERMRLSPAQLAQIQQRQVGLRQGAARLDTQERTLRLRMLEANDRLKTAMTVRDRNRAYTQLTRLRSTGARLKLQKLWNKLSRRGRGTRPGTDPKVVSIDTFIQKNHSTAWTVKKLQDRALAVIEAARAAGADPAKRAQVKRMLDDLRKGWGITSRFLAQLGQRKKLRRYFGAQSAVRTMVDKASRVAKTAIDRAAAAYEGRTLADKKQKRTDERAAVVTSAKNFRTAYGAMGLLNPIRTETPQKAFPAVKAARAWVKRKLNAWLVTKNIPGAKRPTQDEIYLKRRDLEEQAKPRLNAAIKEWFRYTRARLALLKRMRKHKVKVE